MRGCQSKCRIRKETLQATEKKKYSKSDALWFLGRTLERFVIPTQKKDEEAEGERGRQKNTPDVGVGIACKKDKNEGINVQLEKLFKVTFAKLKLCHLKVAGLWRVSSVDLAISAIRKARVGGDEGGRKVICKRSTVVIVY